MSRPGDFWARRRAAVEAEARADEAALEQQALADERAALEEKDDAEILAELKLPDPESLELGDDIRGFMSKAVPDRLRRRALRKLWRLNPVLANVDGLVDYGEDFTDSAMVIENMQTAYQVGKGMLAHIEEMARQAEAEAEAEAAALAKAEVGSEEDTSGALADNDIQEAGPTPINPVRLDPEPPAQIAQASAPEETQQDLSDTRYDAPVYRRMRFSFDSDADTLPQSHGA